MKHKVKLLLLLAASFLAVAGAVIGNTQQTNRSLPPALSRLPEAKLVEIKDEAGQIVLSGEFKTTIDTKTIIERVALLAGARGAKGKAEIELVKNGDTFSKQELEVAVEGLAKISNFKLFVDNTEVIAFTSNKSGKAAMEFSEKNAKK